MFWTLFFDSYTFLPFVFFWYVCRTGRVYIQGLVTLRDANGSTGGLVVVPESHREHQHLCQRSAWVLNKKNGCADKTQPRLFVAETFLFFFKTAVQDRGSSSMGDNLGFATFWGGCY